MGLFLLIDTIIGIAIAIKYDAPWWVYFLIVLGNLLVLHFYEDK